MRTSRCVVQFNIRLKRKRKNRQCECENRVQKVVKGAYHVPRPEDTAFLFPSVGKRKETSTETVHELPGIVYMICCSPFSFFLSFFFSLFLHFWLSFFFCVCLSFHLISLFSFVLLEKEQRESLTFSAKRERLCYMHRKIRTILCYFFVLFFSFFTTRPISYIRDSVGVSWLSRHNLGICLVTIKTKKKKKEKINVIKQKRRRMRIR